MADEAYLRESILNPQAKIVAGFQPIMPTFQGLVSEERPAAADRVHQVAEGRAGERAGAARAAASGSRAAGEEVGHGHRRDAARATT